MGRACRCQRCYHSSQHRRSDQRVASDSTDAIIDVNGYFVPPTDPNGLVFYPLPPCRVADTRLGSLPEGFGTPKMAAAFRPLPELIR